jgi:hypothetical protein
MASKFAITAELNLQTKNLSQVVNNLKRQFQGIDFNIKIKDLANAESQVRGIGKAADGASKSIGSLGSSIADAAKRFSAITLATGTFVGLTRAIKNAVGDAIEFEREMVKIAQATGKTVSQLRGLELEVGNIATGMGASSKELINAARNLIQAGFAADKVTGSLKILAQTDLAATFKSIEDTTDGAIAILNQFGREAQRTGTEVAFLERSLSAINQVSKDFAVESSDLITAVKTTGSAFESAGGSLNELIALFTSVRSTTRESAESIATGFRTIFTRVQRVDTLNNLRDLGIELQDVKGQFVGPMEAAKRLSIALSSIDPKDFRFNLIVEQLGGFRQVSKVIPLIQQFAVAQKALGVAQNSSGSLAKDAATAQQALAVQIQRTREEFLRFIKDLTQSSSFQSTISSLLEMANAFIKVADTLKPMIPLIASFGALKLGQSLLPSVKSFAGNKKAQGGKIHKFASGGMVPGSGNGDTVPAMLTPGEFVIRKSSVKKLGADNLARANKYAGGGPIQYYEKGSEGGVQKNDVARQKKKDLPEGSVTHFTHLDKLSAVEGQKIYSSFGIDLPGAWNLDWDKAPNDYGPTPKRLAKYITQKDIFKTLKGQGSPTGNRLYGFGNDQADIAKNIITQYGDSVKINFARKVSTIPLDILDTDGQVLSNKVGEKLIDSFPEKATLGEGENKQEYAAKDILSKNFKTIVARKEQREGGKSKKRSYAARFRFNDGRGLDYESLAKEGAAAKIEEQKKAFGGLIQKFALGGPAGKSRAANAITIPKIDTYSFEKAAGADLDGTNSQKQQYKLNAEDRLDYNLKTVNVDVDKLKVSKGLLESYRTGDEQNRGFRFEDILVETGMAKSVSMLSNARLDGITKDGDPFEAKSRKTAISAGELEDKLYGAIVDNISEPEKLTRARFNANDLTEKEDHIKIGGVTVFEDVTRGLGAAVKTKARMGYAEEEAAKEAKEQSKMDAVSSQERLKNIVDKKFNSGYKVFGTQYSPIKEGALHRDVAGLLNKKLGGRYQDKLSGMSDEEVIKALDGVIVRKAMGGGNLGTDTVPAMLTPGEYVINKKSAQAIGYGSLNRMNKVGKFASGGPVGVQRFAGGGPVLDPVVLKMLMEIKRMISVQGPTPTGGSLGTSNKQIQTFLKMVDALNKAGIDASKFIKEGFAEIKKDATNFKVSKELKAAYKQTKAAPAPTATEKAGKLKAELDDLANKGNTVNSGLLILASAITGVVSQMSGLEKETADYITALTGTFASINGIGQNLRGMSVAYLASSKADREHRAAVEADKKALEQHTSAVSGTASTGDEQPSKFASRLNLASKAAEGAIMGYAAAQAVSAARIAAINARADKASEGLGRAMEKFATSANNEVEVRNGMIKTLMLSEEAQAKYKASTSTEASVGGAAGGGIGAIIGGALGSLGGPAGTAIGVQVGATIGSFAGTFFGTELAKNFDSAKVAAAAKGISGAFTTASKGILDTNKYFEKIESKDLNDVNQQFSKMNNELIKAQKELSSFDPKIVTTGSEQIKAQFNKAADTVRNFENSIGRLAGVKLQRLNTLITDMAKLGQKFDIGPVLKAQQEEITKVLNAKYNPDIARATSAGKGELAKGLTEQRDQAIAQAGREAEKALLEITLQAFQTEKALLKERIARDAIIGTLIEEKALKNTLQNFKYAIQQASKASGELDAAFSDSVAGLKSSVPDAGVFDLDMPDAADLEPALAALRTIGPIGEKLATNLTDLNTVIPNLEVGLESLAKAQATGGASTDINKLIGDTVEKGFGVSLGSAVGKRLSDIIKDRMTGKGGNVENANPSILSSNTREAIIKEFTDYAQAIKSMSKETLQAWAESEQEQLKILDKINQSENRKLELTNQGVDSYGRMVEAVSKAYGKNVPLAVKNMQRFAKQFNSIGKTAYSSIQDIGKSLKQAKGQLAQGVKDPLEAGKLQNTANRLEQSLKTLANQSDRAGDTLAELEKFKAQREAITSAGASYAFGSDEQRKSKDDATVALQQVMASGGDLDSVSSDMRGQIDSLLGELGDAGKNIKKQLTANFFAKRGNMDMANMVMSESSGPEQKLIAELGNIYKDEIAAQKELKDLEIMYGQGQIAALNQVTDTIKGFNDQLKGKQQKAEQGAQNIQKAAGVTDSRMTVKEIDDIINSTKTSLTKVEDNIVTFAKYLSELNDYLAFVKNPEEFKKTGAPIPAKPGAVPVAKAKGGIIYKADGGFTPRGTDTVPAMLTPGEFVIRKSAVDSIGVDNLEAMNNGYASGGLVSYFRRGGRAMNYGRSANNKRQKAIARRDERRVKKAQEMQQQSADQSFNQASTASVQGLGADPMQALQPTGFNTNVVANPSPVSVPDLQKIYDDRQKSDAQFNPLTVVERIKEQQKQQDLTVELAKQNEIARVKNKKAMDEETSKGFLGNFFGNIKQKFGFTGGVSEAQQATNAASYQGELESQKNASGPIEKALEFTRGFGVGAGQGATGLANLGAGAVDLAGRQVGVDVGANAAVTSVQNAAFGSQESLKSSTSQVGSFLGRTGAGALQAGAGLASGAATGAIATSFGTQVVADIGLTALNDSGALDNFSEGQRAGVGMLSSALIGRGTKKLAPKSINNQSLTGSIARGAVSKAGNLKDAAVSRAGKIKDTVLGPKKFSYAQQAKNNVKSGQLSSRNKFINKQPTTVSPGGVLPRGTSLGGSPSNKTIAPKRPDLGGHQTRTLKTRRTPYRGGKKSTAVPEYPELGGWTPKKDLTGGPDDVGAYVAGRQGGFEQVPPTPLGGVKGPAKPRTVDDEVADIVRGLASGGLVEYHARGGRAGARARAAQRRQNKMQAEQEFPSMAQVGPQNVHRDLAGTPVTRSVMNDPQNFAQARNARTRKAATRGVPGYLSEMAGMGQTINVGADTEESQVRTKYSRSGANQFAEGEERQAMLKEIADARQRDKDKYSPERMRSLYGEKNTPKPTAPRVAAPVAPASTMGATAPKAKPKYDGYTNREYPKSNKPLTAVEKAMQAVRPGWRSANFANGGVVHLARGGRVGGSSGGGKIRRYAEGGNVDPYTEGNSSGGGEMPQMPDMSGFAKSIESLNAFVGSFEGFSQTMAGLASQLSSVTVSHNVTFGGQVNVGGVSGEGIVNAMKSTIEGWIKDQISKNPDVQKAVNSSDQTRKG